MKHETWTKKHGGRKMPGTNKICGSNMISTMVSSENFDS